MKDKLNSHKYAQLELPLAKRWNPRYLAYCAASGSTPDQMLAADRHRYPGGCMCGFILWSMGKWAKFRTLPGNRAMAAKLPQFDVWLMDQAKAPQADD